MTRPPFLEIKDDQPHGWLMISPLTIAHYRGHARDTSLRGVSGCYAIYGDGELLYVGSAVDLDTRLLAHIRELGMLTPQSVITVGRRNGPRRVISLWHIKYRASRFYGDWATRELRLLRRLAPPMNCVNVARRGAAYG